MNKDRALTVEELHHWLDTDPRAQMHVESILTRRLTIDEYQNIWDGAGCIGTTRHKKAD